MKTAVSHLGAGICQTVFMNSICHPDSGLQRRRGWEVWVCIFRRMGRGGRRHVSCGHPAPSPLLMNRLEKLLGTSGI